MPQPSLSRSAGLQQVLVEGGVEVRLVTDDNVEEINIFEGQFNRITFEQVTMDWIGLNFLTPGV